MKKNGKILILIAVISVIFISIYMWLDSTALVYEFKDTGMKLAVDILFEGESEPDYTKVTSLDLKGRNISELSGIENFTGLKELFLDDNDISDVKPLKNLKNLEVLSLSGNFISDAGPLEYLSGLKELDLSQNCDLKDISFVRGIIGLQKLNLRDCSVEELKPLKNLKDLRYLNLHSNISIKSISPLYGLTNLETLILRNVNIEDDIKYIVNMVNLRRLNIRNTGVSDLTTVISLMKRGALQDDLQRNVIAQVDIRDNPVVISANRFMADYWQNVTLREPLDFPVINPVDFSLAGGFYSDELNIEMVTYNTGSFIYYTLDGSSPDPDNVDSSRKYTIKDPLTGRFSINNTTTYVYEGPLHFTKETIGKKVISQIPLTVAEADMNSKWQAPEDDVINAVVLRAVAYVDGIRGTETTATYFLADKPDLPVISIVTDPGNLFDYYKGIYVPGDIYYSTDDYEGSWMQHPANYHESTEYPAHVEFFNEDTSPGFSLNTGLRIHGGWSRSKALKNLRFYARSEYDILNRINFDLFSDDSEGSYKRFILRSGFEDSIWNTHANKNVNVDLLSQRPAIHYINGEYWGLVYISERFDRYYLENRYGVDPDEVTILEGPSAILIEGSQAYEKEFQGILDFVRNNDMSIEENYGYVDSRTDILSFIDYNIVRIYSSCEDAIIKHIKVWKVPGEKWKWHTWDFDYALSNVYGNTIEVYGNDNENKYHDPKHTSLLTGLLKNEKFRNLFVNRFCDLMNTLYLPEEFIKTLNNEASKVEKQLDDHLQRWKQYSSYTYWESLLSKHEEFAVLRPDIQREQIAGYFIKRDIDIGKAFEVEVSCLEGSGKIILNTLEGLNYIRGKYFANVPVAVKAVSEEGYNFSHWLLNGKYFSSDTEEIFYPEPDMKLEAVFTDS